MQQHFADIHTLAATDAPLDNSQFAAKDNSKIQLDLQAGMIDWKLLAQTQLVFSPTNENVAIHTNPAITRLNHTTIQAKGFMFPLEQTAKQTHFLLSPYPPSCPFCLPAGPTELMDITADKPFPFTYDAITVKGVFELVTNQENIKEGMLYRLQHAALTE
jgi:hypothetical protein